MKLATPPTTATESARKKLLAQAFEFFSHTLRTSITASELVERSDLDEDETRFALVAIWSLSDLKIVELSKDRNQSNPEIKLSEDVQAVLEAGRKIEDVLFKAAQKAERELAAQEEKSTPAPIPFAPLLFGGLR